MTTTAAALQRTLLSAHDINNLELEKGTYIQLDSTKMQKVQNLEGRGYEKAGPVTATQFRLVKAVLKNYLKFSKRDNEILSLWSSLDFLHFHENWVKKRISKRNFESVRKSAKIQLELM